MKPFNEHDTLQGQEAFEAANKARPTWKKGRKHGSTRNMRGTNADLFLQREVERIRELAGRNDMSGAVRSLVVNGKATCLEGEEILKKENQE